MYYRKIIKIFFNFYKKVILYKKLKRKKLPKYFCIRQPENKYEYDEMYALRYLVYCEEYKYLDRVDYLDKRERDKYDPYSVHYILVYNKFKQSVVGTVRIIKNSTVGFPIENNFKLRKDLYNINKDKIVEISRLIVKKEYRSQYFMLDLFKKLYQYCKENNITHIYAVMDDNLHKPLVNMGFIFKKIGEVGSYQGLTTPYLLTINDLENSLYKNNKVMFDYLKYSL